MNRYGSPLASVLRRADLFALSRPTSLPSGANSRAATLAFKSTKRQASCWWPVSCDHLANECTGANVKDLESLVVEAEPDNLEAKMDLARTYEMLNAGAKALDMVKQSALLVSFVAPRD